MLASTLAHENDKNEADKNTEEDNHSKENIESTTYCYVIRPLGNTYSFYATSVDSVNIHNAKLYKLLQIDKREKLEFHKIMIFQSWSRPESGI